MMQQESSSLSRRGPPNHGKAQRGDLLFSCPQQRTHTKPTHVHKTHTPTVPKLTLSTKTCSLRRASLNKVVFSPNCDCGWTEQIGKLPWFHWFNSGMIFGNNKNAQTVRFTYLQLFQAQLCANKQKRQKLCKSGVSKGFYTFMKYIVVTFLKTNRSKINRLNCGSSPPSVPCNTAAKMTLCLFWNILTFSHDRKISL